AEPFHTKRERKVNADGAMVTIKS
ncbi:MAG: hypothetical protein RLZZ488_532, partial [Pseudomonadota bacterium]